MNCKQGDLAIIIRGCLHGKQIGKAVTCLELFTGTFGNGVNASDSQIKWWIVDCDIELASGKICRMAPDKCLMPINPRNDESIQETDELTTE
jgi:hypothetical protein